MEIEEHSMLEQMPPFEQALLAPSASAMAFPQGIGAHRPPETLVDTLADNQNQTDRDLDFYAWLKEQAVALRTYQPKRVDWEGIAEELEAMGQYQEDTLESFLKRLYKHLLKWAYQPAKQSASWEVSISDSRVQIERRLKRSPSLKSKIDELATSAYRRARDKVGAKMKMRRYEWLRRLPDKSPWELDQITDTEFWPDPTELNP
jgi:Domain of unknown function DUF29